MPPCGLYPRYNGLALFQAKTIFRNRTIFTIYDTISFLGSGLDEKRANLRKCLYYTGLAAKKFHRCDIAEHHSTISFLYYSC